MARTNYLDFTINHGCGSCNRSLGGSSINRYGFDQQRLIWYVCPIFSVIAQAEKQLFSKLVFECLVTDSLISHAKAIGDSRFGIFQICHD